MAVIPKPTEVFDAAIAHITQERGANYGHPADDFAAAAKLKRALPKFDDPRIRHIAEMICLKLVRLSNNPAHMDSWIDIAGYARTGVMILERDSLTDAFLQLQNSQHKAGNDGAH